MKKIILFGTSLWPTCEPAREILLENDIRFAYVDISSSILNLKRFLAIRDTAPGYQEIREKHYVGVPCLQIEDQVMYIPDADFVRNLIKEGAFV